ncbi:MAG: GntR family transcriptional regulator [Frankiales bacterium]|nr:GntR family transcriptional regulator [Frankiales bacterium]
MQRLQPPEVLPWTGTSGRLRADEARRVRDVLRWEILAAPAAWKLPSEEQLIRSFSVSRNTVRVALGLLREEGLLERVQGAGTFTRARHTRHRLDLGLDMRTSLHGRPTLEYSVLVAERRPAPEPLRRALQLGPTDDVVLIERVAVLDHVPLLVSTGWFPAHLAAPILDLDLTSELSDLLVSIGLEVRAGEFSVEAVRADSTATNLLGVRGGAPILRFTFQADLVDGTPIELSFLHCRGDRLELVPQLLQLGRQAGG